MKVAVDWDGTLVDPVSQEWLDGALTMLMAAIRAGDEVFIHTCRGNYPEGVALVQNKLWSEGLTLDVVGKPVADLYVDDRNATRPEWQRMPRTPPRVKRAPAKPAVAKRPTWARW